MNKFKIALPTTALLGLFYCVKKHPKGLVSFKKNDITIDPDYNGDLDQILYKR